MPLVLAKCVYLILTIFFALGQQEASAQKGKGRSQNQQASANQQTPTPQPQATPTQLPVEQPKAQDAGGERQEQQKQPEGWFTPEWATALSNYLLLLLIVIQTAIYACQLSEMRKMKGVSERQAATMDAQVGAMQAQLEIMQTQTEAMQEGLNETRSMVSQNERSAKAMELAIEESRISREIENRAFVGVFEIRLDAALAVGLQSMIKYRYTNTGRTPARNVTVRMFLRLQKTEEHLDVPGDPVPEQSHAIMLPGVDYRGSYEAYKLTDQEMNALTTLKYQLYLQGHVTYEDVFGNKRETKVCASFSTFTDTTAHYCTTPGHNVIE